MPTVAGASNVQAVSYVRHQLQAVGARVSVVKSPMDVGEVIVASIGPDVPGGLIFSGHLDVVSVEGQNWISDPFKMRKCDDKLFGRGTTDMKGFVACAISTMQSMAHLPLRRPIHLFLSADEETTCQSVNSLIAHAKTELPPARGVVVGEPTLMCPATQHKGSATYLVEITGRSIHASIPDQGVSATAVAGRLIAWLDQQMEANAVAATGDLYAPNYTTHTIGTLSGGDVSNTVADYCQFQWDIRLMPGSTIDDILYKFKKQFAHLTYCGRNIAKEIDIRLTREAYFPALLPGPSDGMLAELLTATGASKALSASFGTEAGIFQQAGYDAIICGPGNAEQAHLENEFIEVAQLKACLRVLDKLSDVNA